MFFLEGETPMNWDGVRPSFVGMGSGKRVGINVRDRGEGFSPGPLPGLRRPLEQIPEGPDFIKMNQCEI
jgi:hypothetical protein